MSPTRGRYYSISFARFVLWHVILLDRSTGRLTARDFHDFLGMLVAGGEL